MLRVRLVGGMRVWLDDAVVEQPSSRRAWALLAWLALHPGMHPRATVASTFWPDVVDASARASLRSAVWALRQSLGDAADDYLRLDRDHIGLRDDAAIAVDVRAVKELLTAGRTREAVDLGAGDLLPELDDAWAIEAREAYRPTIAAALEELALAAGASDDIAGAIAWTRRQIDLDRLAEEPQRRLMTRLAASGDRAAALSSYDRFRQKLAHELAIRPSAETERLAEELRTPRDRPGVSIGSTNDAWPLTGRGRELADLTAAWQSARTGRAVAATITGEPGIGKSRLAAEVAALARDDGAVVVSAATVDLGVSAPFGMWVELIAGLASVLDNPPPDAVWPSMLAPLVPDFESRLGRSSASPTHTSPQLERARLYEATAGLLLWATRGRPLVLVLEDVHVADVASLDLIGYVCRRLARSPMLVILTRRPLPRRVQVDAVENSLRAQRILRTEIALGPLGRQDGVELAHQVADLPADQVDQVVAAADGNPLLVVEWAAAVARGEDQPPNSLRAAVRTALVPLKGDALELGRFAAIAGRSLDRPEVERLPLESPRDAMAAAGECSLLTISHGRVGFRHALLREAAYVDLTEPVRDDLHERFGLLLGDLEPRLAAEAARHLALAGRDDLVVPQLVRAADHARSLGALPEAAAILTEALTLQPDNRAVLLDLAEVEAFRSLESASDSAFTRAVADIPDQAMLAAAWVRRATWYSGAICHPRLALDAARTAVDVMDRNVVDDTDLRIEALALWSWTESVAGDVDVADELLDRVQGMLGKRRPTDRLVPAIGRARAFAHVRRGRFRESYPSEIASAEASKRLGRPDLSYGSWTNAACAATCAGDFDRALEFVDRGLADVAGAGLDSLEFHLLAGRSHILARLGRDDEARETAEQQRGIAERLNSDSLRSVADHDAGLLALRLGDTEQAVDLLRSALDHDAEVSRPSARLHRAEALVALGRWDEAEDELRLTSLEPVVPGDMPEGLVPRLTALQGSIAHGRGDDTRAHTLLREAAAGWERVVARATVGDQFVASIADFGRPPVVGLVEPARELDRVLAELRALEPVRLRS